MRCPLMLLRAVLLRRRPIDRYFLHAGRTAANPPHAVGTDRQTDRQTDGRTPNRFIDPAPLTTRIKGKWSPYLIADNKVPELIPVLGSQPACDVSHKPGGRLPLLSARPAVTPATLKKAATNFATW